MARYNKPVVNFNADDVWAAAATAQRINGSYVKLGMFPESDPEITTIPNRQIVENLMVDPTVITDEDRDQGKKIRQYFQGFTFKILQGQNLSEFNNTAMLISNRDVIISLYDLAVICSLPASYERGIKKQTISQRIKFASGGYVAPVGNKVSTTIEILQVVFSIQWNVHYITGINKDDQVVFFPYKKEFEIGKTIDICGTVKAHRDNSTQLNRVKVIA